MAGELILVVEDNEKNLKLALSVLEFCGYRTLAASTAEDGLALARDQAPHLILMDIQLPGMDGVAALNALRTDDATRGIRVVALTAFAMKGDRERFLAAGFDGYLVKPIDVDSFPTQIRQFCDGVA